MHQQQKHYGNKTPRGGKEMYGWPLSLIDSFVAFISKLWPFHFYLWDYILTPLWSERVTQTRLMRRYWLWLLWQLLIRHWLGTVAICWGGRKQTVRHDLAELLPLHPPTCPVRRALCAQTVVSPKDRRHYIQRIKNTLLGYTVLPGVKLLRQRLKLIRSSTILFWQLVFAALHTSHPLCMLIKQSLRGCRLMGCRAEPRKTWENRETKDEEGWRSEWRGILMFRSFGLFHWKDV